MKNKKICVYTCITGNYDDLKEIDKNVYEKNIDYYCFTNNKNIKSDTWKIIYISDDELDNHMLSRKIKILGHEIINNNYDISVWIDGAVSLNMKISDFLKNECDFKNYELFCFKHSARNCIYEEAKACIQFMKDNPDNVRKQIKFLKSDNYPENYGLCEMTMFIRDLHSKTVTKTMELWFDMLLNYSKRDQLSFMYCVYKTNVKLQIINLNVFNNKYFDWSFHSFPKKIEKYLAYFGRNENNLDYYFLGQYENNKNDYIAKFTVLNDTDYIKFTLANTVGIYFNGLEKLSDNIEDYFVPGVFEVNNKKYLLSGIPCLELFGNFKTGDTVEIKLNLIKIDEFQYTVLLEENDNYIKKIKNESEENICLLKSTLNNLENEYRMLLEENELLKKDNEIMNSENQKLSKENEKNLNLYQSVVNSKGWIALEKLRKIKNVGVKSE